MKFLGLLGALLRTGGFEALSRRTGLSASVISETMRVLVPDQFQAMRDFVRANGGNGAGVDALLGLIDEHGDGDLAARLLSHDPISGEPGRDLIAKLYGDDAAQDMAIDRIASEAGQNRDTVSRIAPLAMMLLGGFLSAISGTGARGGEATRGLGEFYTALVAPGED